MTDSTRPELSSESAAIAVLLSTLSTLAACVGAWMGTGRALAEAYRSCPVDETEIANGRLATALGMAALIALVITFFAALVGLLQGVRRRSMTPAKVTAWLGAATVVLGVLADVIPATTMC
ncbi:MAG TPA: hypothetical protein VL400_05800 [Polyangiaceae bacterium]|nr:hypothetical protein [Polyangiaceae bacterium]